MKPQSVLKIANRLARDYTGRGVDHNQIRSMVSYLVMRKTRGDEPGELLEGFRELVLALPKSEFAKRTNESRRQFQKASEEVSKLLDHIYPEKGVLTVEALNDLIELLGWTARLIPYNEMLD